MPDTISFEQIPEAVRHWFGGGEATRRLDELSERFNLAPSEEASVVRLLVALQTRSLDPERFRDAMQKELSRDAVEIGAIARELVAKLLEPIGDALAVHGVDVKKLNPDAAISPVAAETRELSPLAPPAPRAAPAPFILHKKEVASPLGDRSIGPVIPREALFKNAALGADKESVRAEVDFGDTRPAARSPRVVHYSSAETRSPVKRFESGAPANAVAAPTRAATERVENATREAPRPPETHMVSLPPDSRAERASAASVFLGTPANQKVKGLSLEEFRQKLAGKASPQKSSDKRPSQQSSNQR
ncbi:MAG: hypothetical protein HY536_00125 [Candidatus Colwellbacteria bacterium]|nr:hypothetical protein [Candidatus Colwellbacteria bacterium]